MTEKDFFKAIEKLNKEKIELKNKLEYKIGERLLANYLYFKKMKFNKIFKNINDKIASNIIKKKFIKINKTNNFNYYDYDYDYKKNKIVVYTCVIGEYDNIQKPLIQLDNVDYVLLTDKVEYYEKFKDIYSIKKIPDNILFKGNILANRYIKFHPFEFFENYDYAIYLDGNVRVISDISNFISCCSEKTGIAMHRHRERNCIYDEATVCKLLRRGNLKLIKKQIMKYKEDGFPENFGMCEATVIVTNLKNITMKKLMNDWWNEFEKTGSLRDQIAFPYVIWKNNYKIDDIGNLGENIYENYKLELVKHN